MLTHHTREPQVVEGRRAQSVDHSAYVEHAVGDLGLDLAKEHRRRGIRDRPAVAQGIALQAGRRERGTDPVMQVASDPQPLLLAPVHDALSRLLEVVGQSPHSLLDGHLAGQVAEQLHLAGVEGSPSGPAADEQVTLVTAV